MKLEKSNTLKETLSAIWLGTVWGPATFIDVKVFSQTICEEGKSACQGVCIGQVDRI